MNADKYSQFILFVLIFLVSGVTLTFAVAFLARGLGESKLLRLRGAITDPERRCRSCGGDTRRKSVPMVLQPFKSLYGDGFTYRYCARCNTSWLSFLRGRSQKRAHRSSGAGEPITARPGSPPVLPEFGLRSPADGRIEKPSPGAAPQNHRATLEPRPADVEELSTRLAAIAEQARVLAGELEELARQQQELRPRHPVDSGMEVSSRGS